MDIRIYPADIQNCIMELAQQRGRDPHKTYELCNFLEERGKKSMDDALLGYAAFSRGETAYLLNDMTVFYQSMMTCIPHMEKIGEWGYVAMANNMLGIMSLNRGNAPFAMDYYLKAMSICEDYMLPDLEWMIFMNIATMYLSIHEYAKAVEYLDRVYSYLMAHKDAQDHISNLTVVYISLGKAYLSMEDISRSQEYDNRIKVECEPFADTNASMAIWCFEARLYQETGQLEEQKKCIRNIHDKLDENLPILDYFDDFYDYLELLQKVRKGEEFTYVIKMLSKIAETADILYLEQKLLSICLHYAKTIGDEATYQRGCRRYFELSEGLAEESQYVVANTIALRNSLNDLAEINREVRKENVELQRKSQTDALTGMNNRFLLNTYGEEAFQNAIKNHTSIAVEILDIDYFKQFNDNYGHQAGDECIRGVAKAIEQQRQYGRIFTARYGGDEFVVIYEGFSLEDVTSMGQALKQRIEAMEIEHAYSKAAKVVTVSQGICWDLPTDDRRLWDLLHQADSNLYQVKQVSRNSVRISKYREN